MKVLIAPDSFKGTISNSKCAQAIAEGWLSLRNQDTVSCLPMADGGEGTLETIALKYPSAIRIPTKVSGNAFWLLLSDGTAIVELAIICGLTEHSTLDPLQASTFDLGLVLKEVIAHPEVVKILLALGGSASTDGGAGALMALGARLANTGGNSIGLGGVGLTELDAIDLTQMPSAPTGGVTCLTDVTNLLLGDTGSARVFSPQKGASEAQIGQLENGLRRLQEISGREDFAGAGAAGGTAFGLSLAWDIKIESGSQAVATIIGLESAIAESDLIITGEGKLDSQSYSGKVLGAVTQLAQRAGKQVLYCVGSSELPLNSQIISLVDIAPSLQAAMERPEEWLVRAGAELARRQKD